jgi:hypothetical protein
MEPTHRLTVATVVVSRDARTTGAAAAVSRRRTLAADGVGRPIESDHTGREYASARTRAIAAVRTGNSDLGSAWAIDEEGAGANKGPVVGRGVSATGVLPDRGFAMRVVTSATVSTPMPNQATGAAYESNLVTGVPAVAGALDTLFAFRRQARKRTSRSRSSCRASSLFSMSESHA